MSSRAARPGGLSPAAVLILVLLVSAVLCHGFLLWAPFIYDDSSFILADPRVTGAWPGLSAFFGRTFGGGEYEPLGTLFHWAMFHEFGATPWPYRLTSILLHWANVWLVWRLLRRWLEDEYLALAGAALFCVFPAHVEVLALSTYKKHLGVAFFGLLTLEVQERRGWASAARAALGGALLFVAALCKEHGLIFLPLAAAAAAARGGRRRLREDGLFLGALSLAAAVYVGVRAGFLPRTLSPFAGGGPVPAVLTAAKILLWHLGQLVVPSDLAIEHGLTPVRSFGLQGALFVAGALGWVAFGAVLARRDRVAAFGWAWVTLSLAPFLNLVPFMNFSLVANRYEYLADAGFLLLVARLAQPLLRPAARGGGRRVLLAASLPFAFYAAQSARFAVRFDSPYDIWSDALAGAPDNPRALAAVGALKASWHDDAGAEADLRRALALAPGLPEACVSLSWLLAETGREDEALAYARRRLALRQDSTGWANLGLLLTRAGRFAEALPALQEAARLTPGPDASLALGQCLLGLRRYSEADADLRAALADPDLRAKALRALGDSALAQGRRGEAEDDWRGSLAVAPLQPETTDALARALVRGGRRAEALALYDALIARLRSEAAELTAETPAQKTDMEGYLSGRIGQVERERGAAAKGRARP